MSSQYVDPLMRDIRTKSEGYGSPIYADARNGRQDQANGSQNCSTRLITINGVANVLLQ
jgi:hypothetical protein